MSDGPRRQMLVCLFDVKKKNLGGEESCAQLDCTSVRDKYAYAPVDIFIHVRVPVYTIRLCPPLLPRKKSMQLYWSRPRLGTIMLLPFERLATTRSLVLALLSRCCRRPSSKERSIGSSIKPTAPGFHFYFPRPVTQTYRCKAGKLGKDTAA